MELTPGIWKAVGGIGSGISLLAFLAAVLASWHARTQKDKLRTIEKLRGEQLLEALDTVLVGMRIPSAGLTREQRFKLASGRLDQAYRRYRLIVLAALATALIVSILAGYSIRELHQKPSQVQEWDRVMVANFEQSEYDAAETIADKILQKEPDNLRALSVKGSAAAFRQDYRTAIGYFQKAYQRSNTIPVLKRNLAYALLQSGRVEEATKFYEDLRDGSPESDYSVAFAYVAGKQYDKAIEVLETLPSNQGPVLKTKNPSPPGQGPILEAAAFLGRGFTGDREKAIEKLRFGVAQNPLYWKPILHGEEKDPNNDYRIIIPILAQVLDKIDN